MSYTSVATSSNCCLNGLSLGNVVRTIDSYLFLSNLFINSRLNKSAPPTTIHVSKNNIFFFFDFSYSGNTIFG